MLELDNLKLELESYRQPLKNLHDSLDLDNKINRIDELNHLMEEPDFWTDPQKSTKQSKELGSLKEDVSTYQKLESSFEDMFGLIELANEEGDSSMVDEIKSEYSDFKENYEKIRLKTLLSEEYDNSNAILRLNAGAGGTESCDWCNMLFRMYNRWAERHGFSVDVLDVLDGDEAGIKNATFQINGENAYGYLKSEKGVHRLVRISPFNAQGKRQTSFVSCEVMPELDSNIEVEIRPEDIRIDTYRSSGAGGQHINKTSSAIRITHYPTGIVVTCQNERSQFQNKDKAMEILKSRLFILAQEEEEAKRSGIRGETKDIAWGSQIRSYFLQPYQLIKDLRTGCEVTQADSVLDGGIDPFIDAYLIWKANGGKMPENVENE
ncbi:MAG: peptide chain release factor 2 [Lachnospiraceae bacterium]|nr:peptide chain release factor 2 [Lachnospiraceae bacterium]